MEALKTRAISAEALQSYHMALRNEEHPDISRHDIEIKELEKEWPQYRNTRHHGLSQLPRYMQRQTEKPVLWETTKVNTEVFERKLVEAKEDGDTFVQNYLDDVQVVLSRTHGEHTSSREHNRTKEPK